MNPHRLLPLGSTPRGGHKAKLYLTVSALVLLTLGAGPSAAQSLQYFGYAGTTSEDTLVTTSGYTNIVYFGATTGPEFIANMDRLTAHKQKALFNTAPVVWDFTFNPPVLFSDWQARWDTWTTANSAALIPGRVLAIEPFDEPMNWGIDMKGYEAVCAYIKLTLPWVKILHVDGLSSSTKGNVDAYIRAGGTLPNVDWIALDAYCIHPGSDAEYLTFVALYKTAFPGRGWFYVVDGFWDATHVSALGPDINVMGPIAEEWYQLALTDPDAIGLGVFLWEGGDTQDWIQSKDFPASVLAAHREVGNSITHRSVRVSPVKVQPRPEPIPVKPGARDRTKTGEPVLLTVSG